MFIFRTAMTIIKVRLFAAISFFFVGGFQNEVPSKSEVFIDLPYVLYTGNSDEFIIGKNIDIKRSPFDLEKPLKLIIHDHNQAANEPAIIALKDEYIAKYDCNVIVLEWECLSKIRYDTAIEKLPIVTDRVTNLLNVLQNSTYNMSSIHIIGNGVGAHIAGLAADGVKGNIARITGLDPANKGFSEGRGLSRYQATFVDVIRTNKLIHGMYWDAGHADFDVNGGIYQPGCRRGTCSCSHQRALLYFIESIRDSKFIAKKCNDEAGEVYLMGEGANTTARGLFCLRTNSEKPFGTLNVPSLQMLKIKY